MKKLFILIMLSCPFIAQATEVTMLAASSLTDSVSKIVKEFEKETGTKVNVLFDSSARLARQIKEGAKADLFMSADKEWTEFLAKEKLTSSGKTIDLLSNELVVIAPKSSPMMIKDFKDLAIVPFKTLCMAFGTTPVGKYGYEALNQAGLFQKVSSRIVHGENARNVLEWVAKNEADLAIVYATDALVEPRVKVIARIPQEFHSSIVYPLSILGKDPQKMAVKLYERLQSEQAIKIFKSYGFKVIK